MFFNQEEKRNLPDEIELLILSRALEVDSRDYPHLVHVLPGVCRGWQELCRLLIPRVDLQRANRDICDCQLKRLARNFPKIRSLTLPRIFEPGWWGIPPRVGRERCNGYLSHAGLASLSHLESLQSVKLNLGYTAIRDAGLARLAGLPLEKLKLHSCWEIMGAGLAHLAGAPLLELDLSYTRVTDAGLRHLAGLPLETLYLRGTNITDAGLRHLAGLPLETLDLCGTNITDAGISHLLSLPLENLNIDLTRITDAGLVLLADLPSLKNHGQTIGLLSGLVLVIT